MGVDLVCKVRQAEAVRQWSMEDFSKMEEGKEKRPALVLPFYTVMLAL